MPQYNERSESPYNVVIVTGPNQVDPYDFHNLLVSAVNESVFKDQFPIDEELLKGTSLHYTSGDLDNTCLILLKCDDTYVGFLCGEVAYMSRYFQKTAIASETLWYVLPEHRRSGKTKEMIELFETWGASNGCEIVTMSSQANQYSDSVNAVYTKLGYTKLEESFLKRIN